ncbi:hypothetical protein GMLC_01980 [Geomonas limicola]|uniref:Uncharacterized protein n=1 Tax=Geomonas limicola TaxID=2740186 RepID=A0A6V8N5Q3_9BACT|nr:hypothetical protein [Geomonas limicola]GFO66619.1 hypothetical protein GMLC_01980 [Geomonas limicola]
MGVRGFFQRLFQDRVTEKEPAVPLPFSHSEFDLQLAWNVSTTGTGTLLSGEVKNLRWAHLEGAELWITALDATGENVAREVCYLLPNLLRQGDTAQFAIRLPLALPPGTRLQFTYRYRGSDGGDGGTTWSQSFEFTVPAAEELRQQPEARR